MTTTKPTAKAQPMERCKWCGGFYPPPAEDNHSRERCDAELKERLFEVEDDD